MLRKMIAPFLAIAMLCPLFAIRAYAAQQPILCGGKACVYSGLNDELTNNLANAQTNFTQLFQGGVTGLTSVGVSTTAPWLTVGNSPLTLNGTITLTPTAGQTANQFLATPCGITGAVALRVLCASDFPASGVTAGSYTSANITVDATGRVTAAANGTGGGSSAFSALTGSTNTTAAMVVGTGASLGASGTGTIAATSAPVAGITGLGTGVGTFLATPSSANLATAVTGETGTGALVFGSGPTITLANATGLPLTTGVTGILPVANGGTGTASPGIVAGTNVTVTGTWPNQTVNSTASGSAFSGISTGTNTTATMTVGTGSSLTTSGTGTINANQINGATVPASAALLASNSSSQATAITLGTGFAIASGALVPTSALNAQTGTSYTFVSGDANKLVTFSNASATAVTLPVATTTGFTAGFGLTVQNIGAGTVTITPTTSTINGASTLVIAQNRGCDITSDGANYQVSACTAITSGVALNSVQNFTAAQTFSGGIGGYLISVGSQSGTTCTLTSTGNAGCSALTGGAGDCGTLIHFTSATAVTVTIPTGLAVGCQITLEQDGAGKVSVNGSAVTAATLHSPHSYTGTSGQYALIGVSMVASGSAVLSGDGS